MCEVSHGPVEDFFWSSTSDSSTATHTQKIVMRVIQGFLKMSWLMLLHHLLRNVGRSRMWKLDEMIRHDGSETVWETFLTKVIIKHVSWVVVWIWHRYTTLWKGSTVQCLFSQPSWPKNKNQKCPLSRLFCFQRRQPFTTVRKCYQLNDFNCVDPNHWWIFKEPHLLPGCNMSGRLGSVSSSHDHCLI